MVRAILAALVAAICVVPAVDVAVAAPAPGKPAPAPGKPAPAPGKPGKPAPPAKPAPDKPAPAPAPSPSPAPTPDRSAPAVDLSMTGAVTARARGTGGHCGRSGATRSVQIQSEDLGGEHAWRLTVVVTSDRDWARPSIVLDDYSGARPDHFTWGRGKTPESRRDHVSGDKSGPSFRIDVHLRNVVRPTKRVHLFGTIRCPG